MDCAVLSVGIIVMFLRKMLAFIKRDFLIARSYKLMFMLNWGGIVTTTLTLQ